MPAQPLLQSLEDLASSLWGAEWRRGVSPWRRITSRVPAAEGSRVPAAEGSRVPAAEGSLELSALAVLHARSPPCCMCVRDPCKATTDDAPPPNRMVSSRATMP